MAVTWEVIISPIDVDEYRASIAGTATDDADPDSPISVSVAEAVIETAPQQTAALDTLYEKYQVVLSRNTQVDAWLIGKEAAAKSYLEAK